MYTIPNLPYKYSDLEPYVDEATMRVHHTKHHQAYVDKLNAALEKYPDLAQKSIEELMSDLEKVPEAIRVAVRNHGGGHLNHSMFWEMLTPPIAGRTSLAREQTISLIDETWGSLENFQAKFKEAALGRFGSGWVWLINNGGKLEIVSIANQDTPLSEGKKILLGLDVWEHAYYLKYQNRRPEYVDAFWSVVNWDYVEKQLS